MDAEAAVRTRLDRIDALDRREASPARLPRAELLAELRGLLRDAEIWAASHSEPEEVDERRRPAPHGT
jgi:hypothetical protein